jgi:Ca2+-binding EF-hand superfamily protein
VKDDEDILPAAMVATLMRFLGQNPTDEDIKDIIETVTTERAYYFSIITYSNNSPFNSSALNESAFLRDHTDDLWVSLQIVLEW